MSEIRTWDLSDLVEHERDRADTAEREADSLRAQLAESERRRTIAEADSREEYRRNQEQFNRILDAVAKADAAEARLVESRRDLAESGRRRAGAEIEANNRIGALKDQRDVAISENDLEATPNLRELLSAEGRIEELEAELATLRGTLDTATRRMHEAYTLIRNGELDAGDRQRDAAIAKLLRLLVNGPLVAAIPGTPYPPTSVGDNSRSAVCPPSVVDDLSTSTVAERALIVAALKWVVMKPLAEEEAKRSDAWPIYPRWVRVRRALFDAAEAVRKERGE